MTAASRPPSGPAVPRPVIDYTARDYDALLRQLLDRMTLTMPAWRERHAPDLLLTLAELLAYTGDQVSYFQDAVATEAYLTTARRRVSVRRHVRLVDYAMHDGCNARAFVTIEVSQQVTLPHGGYRFVAAEAGDLPPREAPGLGPVISDEQLLRLAPGVTREVFEPLGHHAQAGDLRLYPAHNAISFWAGRDEDWLPAGTTRAVLRDDHRELRLRPGDLLVIEEVTSPRTGSPADADPRRRQAVRLTSVTPMAGEPYQQPVLEVTWSRDDALTFDACLRAVGGPAPGGPGRSPRADVSLARGNVVLADHGQSVSFCGSPPEVLPVPHARGVPVLHRTPVTQCTAYPSPRLVSSAQAEILATIGERVRERVRSLWRSVADGHELSPEEAAELSALFGQRDAARAGLASHPERALRELLARFDELLAVKLERLATLTARAAAGTVLDDGIAWELRHTWGNRYAAVLDPADPLLAGPAAAALAQDPRAALPAVAASAWHRDHDDREAGFEGTWLPARDLLAAGPRDRLFVGEAGDDGRLGLRFGDGAHGAMPPADGELRVSYRTGNGTAGNVGAEAINHLVLRDPAQGGGVRAVRNPLPAAGGTDPEPLADVRQAAPLASRAVTLRAITADDYARLAAAHRGVRRAAASIRWTGSGEEVRVAVEPAGPAFADTRSGPQVPSAALIAAVTESLAPFRRIGHGLAVVAPEVIPLDIGMRVRLAEACHRGQVLAALRRALGSGVLPDGTAAFFNPDVLGFGEPVRASRLVAAAVSVPGVTSAVVTRLRRLAGPDEGELAAGLLRIGPLAVASCDSDPGGAENGRLSITLGGQR